jgi:RNA recognition motif-containing protein
MTPKPKLSFWQRIVALFKGSPPAAPEIGEKPVPSATTREKISRKPELVEVTSPKLYVGNLSFDATESDLFELFNGVGQVRNAEVVCHKYTQRSKGFAFVQMTTIEEARRAVGELHDKEFLGRKLVVSGAKTPDMERAA